MRFLFLLVGLVLAAPVGSEVIVFSFEGTVTQAGTFPPGCGSPPAPGAGFSGEILVETSTPDLHPAAEQAIHAGAVVGSSLDLNGVVYDHEADGSLQFQDGYNVTGDCGGAPHDQINYTLVLRHPGCGAAFTVTVGGIDCTGAMVSSAAAIPEEAPLPSFLPFQFLLAPAGGGAPVTGTVTTLSREPSTAVRNRSWGFIKFRTP